MESVSASLQEASFRKNRTGRLESGLFIVVLVDEVFSDQGC